MSEDPKKILIIGGVAGGASAAARLRRLSETAQITILEKGPYVSFANCGLPYALGDVIQEREELILQTPESLKKRFNLDVLINTEALFIDRNRHQVTGKNILTGELKQYKYDKLILSMGAESFRPPIPGSQLKSVFTLQTVPDLDRIQDWIKVHRPKTASVIGGGFIGLEAAENLVKKGIQVTLIERSEQVFPPADRDIAEIVHQELKRNGIELFLGTEVQGIEELSGSNFKINLGFNNCPIQPVKADLVIMAIGVRPRSTLAKEAQLSIGKFGGVKVDEFMRTEDPDIYAVGDLTEVNHFQSAEATYIPLAGPANRQGRIAAGHIFGKQNAYRGTLGTSVCQIFDLTVGITGISTKTLSKMGQSYNWITVHPNDHAGYYPGANQMTLKLIFDSKTGEVLGSQAIGKSGIDKRIDVLSVAIQNHASVYDLEHLELAYAPPYSSAKDPVNMAGFVASNVLRGDVEIIHPEMLDKLLKDKYQLIDVRSAEEFKAGNIPSSVNVPIDDLRERMSEFDLKKPLIVYCQVGFRGYLAYRILVQGGFSVKNLNGGYKSWKQYH